MRNPLKALVWLNPATLGVLFLMPLSSNWAANAPQPLVEIEMQTPVVYAGETPLVKVKLSAPQDSDVAMVKEYPTHSKGYINISLVTDGGEILPGEPVMDSRRLSNDDFELLAAGKSVTMSFQVFSGPAKSGKYGVWVRYMPTPTLDRNFVVEKRLTLVCADFPDRLVKERVSFTLPIGPIAGTQAQTMELSNTKLKDIYTLVYRRLDKDGSVNWFTRVCELDEGSKLLAVPKYFDKLTDNQQIWATFTRKGEIHFMRLGFVGGQVLEDRVLKEGEKPPAEGADK